MFLRDEGFRRYSGIDFSPVAIQKAKERAPNMADRFALGDIRSGDWNGQEYDVVCITEVLEHLDDDQAVLRAIRPGTKVIYSVPLQDSAGHVRYFKDVDQVEKEPECKEAVQELEQSGVLPHRLLIEEFAEAIEQNRDPAITGREGRKSIEIIQAIYESSRSGQPVELPLP